MSAKYREWTIFNKLLIPLPQVNSLIICFMEIVAVLAALGIAILVYWSGHHFCLDCNISMMEFANVSMLTGVMTGQ